jgi:hypothetical protein
MGDERVHLVFTDIALANLVMPTEPVLAATELASA